MPTTPDPDLGPRLLTSDELAAWLNVPARTLDMWSYHQKGPRPIKVGKHRRYAVDEVQRWLDVQTATWGA